jgi:hypothetical protein
LNHLSEKVEAVFSVNLISFPEEEEKGPALEIAKKMGFPIYPNGKVNLGLGRALNP